MDSPVRQYQKQKDYRRHKLFRKIRRRQATERQQAINEPIRQLKRKLKRYDGGKNVEEKQPVISGQQPDMSWHKYWLNNRADILGHNIKDTEIHPIWALQELTGYNFPGFEKIGKERIKEELNNAQKFREYTSPNEMPEKAIQFLHRNLPLGITDQQAYDAKMGGNAGVTYPYQNIVMYHPFSTNVARGHERTHTLNATAQEKKVKQIMMDQYKDRSWFDDYYEDPSEIYARLMNFRYMAKLNPKKKVTVEDLEKWRSDFDLNYGVYAPADNLLRRYNNDTLLRLFNEVAQNNTESVLNEDDLLIANSGKDSGIHIKPENRGKFNALKKRTGKSASWFKAHGTPAQKKMAIFALNARKWKHK